MADPLYLSSIAIQNFRPFRNCQVRVPAPGVLILAGPNGLGKSSFFDAIEWALTGRVKRLISPAKGSQGELLYAHRQINGSPCDNFGVRLGFTPYDVERTAVRVDGEATGFVQQLKPQTSVAALLRSHRWSIDISEDALSTYLHQTHLFLQSSSDRFVYREAQQRWSDIEGPAGVKRMMAIQRGLGKATKSALSKRVSQLERDVALADEEANAWANLIKRRDTLKANAVGGGGTPPERTEENLAELEQALKLKAGDRPVSARLQRVFQAIQDADVRLERQQNLIREGRDIVRSFGMNQGMLHELDRQIAERTELLRTKTSRLQVLQAEGSHLRSSLRVLVDERAKYERKRDQVAEVQHAQVASRDTALAFSELSTRIATSREELAEVRERVREARMALSDFEQNRRRRQELFQQRRAIHDLDVSVQALELRLNQTVGLEREQLDLTDAIANREADLVHQREELLVQEESVQEAREDLAVEIQRRDAVKAAISSIVANLVTGAETCPVCGTHYSTEELNRRMKEALKDGGEDLVRLERRVAEAETEATDLRDTIDVCVQQISLMKEDLARILATRNDLSRQMARVLSSPLLFDGESDVESVKRRIDVLKKENEALLRDCLSPDMEDQRILELEEILNTLMHSERRAELNEVSSKEALSRLDAERRSAEAVMLRYRDIVSEMGKDPDAMIARIVVELEKVKNTSREQRDRLALLERTIASEEKNADSVRVELAALDQQRSDCSRRQATLRSQWNALGLGGNVSSEVVEKADLDSVEARRNNSIWRARHEQIVDGVGRWTAQIQLAEAEAEIDRRLRLLDVQSLDAVGLRLNDNLMSVRGRLEDARKVSAGVVWLDGKVKEEMDEYVPTLLTPLNSVAGRILSALSIFSGQRVEMQAPRRESVYPVSLRVMGDFAGDSLMISPEEMLSEGQLAFVSLGIMLSMSLVYRWSDWRCLLLDDPFQNNDIVRISALVDVLRGLSHELGYQIVVSTHDLGLADFLRRKFLAGGVETVVCRLFSSGDEGVIVD